MNDFSGGQFLEDYFAESDEHLTAIRRGLLALEPGVVRPAEISRQVVQELFRSFHSLKGISGMVGLREAEELAHHAESYLGALRSGRVTLTQGGMDAIVEVTRNLEEVIAARRAEKPEPDISTALRKIKAVSTGTPWSTIGGQRPGTDEYSAEERARASLAAGRGARLWLFEFRPSRELSERGVNVNAIRRRLQETGELIRTSPHVGPGGEVLFSFLLATDAGESTFEPWRADGVNWRPEEMPPAAASAASAEQARPPVSIFAPSSMVRVDVTRLDELMRIVGDLVISRTRLEKGLSAVRSTTAPEIWAGLQETNASIERQLRELREAVMRVRMVPVGEVFERMQFVVRELTGDLKKPARLELSGEKTEIDKLLVERLMDPLLHIVRNALSHGIEPVDERIRAGKKPEGLIDMRAWSEGDFIMIQVKDDGRGIDVEQVTARARAAGLISPDRVLDEPDLLEVLCSPGFSTRAEADLASGRGFGLAVVKNTIAEVGGTLTLQTEPGQWTRFTIRLPLTLAITQALIVSTGRNLFAVPQAGIREVIELSPGSIRVLGRGEMVALRGEAVPLVRLNQIFGAEESRNERSYAFVVDTGSGAVAIAVDRVSDQREIVVRAISDPLIHRPGISGATELGDGRPILILDVEALLRTPRGEMPVQPVRM